MRYLRVFFLSIVVLVSGAQTVCNAQSQGSAKSWVFWYWIKGAVSKQGITADLEAMKQAGIGGAYIATIQGAGDLPLYSPPAIQLTEPWWDLVVFAVKEADRIGVKIGFHVSDGFALAGGPWITPELSMQKVVASETTITGGTKGKIILPQPETKENYYRDIAVYAFPSLPGTGVSTEKITPQITTSNGTNASFLVKKDNKEALKSSEKMWILYAFEKPFTARTVHIFTNGNNVQAQRLIIEASDDGTSFRPVTRLEPPRHGWQDTDEDVTHSIPPTTARYFRFTYDKQGSEPGAEDLDNAKWKPSLKLVRLQLSSEPKIHQYEGKAGAIWRVSKRSSVNQLADNLCVPLNKIINLSDKLNADGTLDWVAPKGNWTIVRVGHTSTGHTNATGGAARGLECDKFNPEAVQLQFNNWYAEAVRRVGPELTPRVLNSFYIDSWECGSQNWSPVFREEFKKRRGYDLLPYLPAMAGIPVQSAEVSEKFLYDVRKTIAELVVDKFYNTMAALAKEKKVSFAAESVAPTMVSDGMLHYKTADVPMGEFWLNSPTHDKPNDMLDAVSAGHIYGKNVIQAEAFTTLHMTWGEYPGMLKTLQDRNYALGLNKLVYHVFVENPWLDRKPGMTLDGVGMYFQRDQTWWKPGKAWVEYGERCQEMLQKGRPMADIAVFTGEEVPRRSVLPERLVPVLPGLFGKDVVEAEAKRLANEGTPMRNIPAAVSGSANIADPDRWVNALRGYQYDSFNPDALSTARVEEGRVVFASGASYKIVVIPGKMALNPNSEYMSMEVAQKLLDLLKAGATILMMEKPKDQPGLEQSAKAEFEKVIDEIWNGNFSGKLLKGPYQEETFSGLGLNRDVIVKDSSGNYAKKIAYTHRVDGTSDIYFISNQEDRERILEFSFRRSSNIVELYNAVTGARWNATDVRTENGRTTLPLKLAPNASLFVTIKMATKGLGIKPAPNWKSYAIHQTISSPWQVQFGSNKQSVNYKQLQSWSVSQDSVVRYFSGTAAYRTTFKIKDTKSPLYLDLGEVANIAEVKVNGVSCGIAWTPPYRVEITKAVKKGNNQLEIEVTNTWANSLIGDHHLPEDKRKLKTTAPFRLEGAPLQQSGLLGPVKVLLEE